jgi:antirestriction protein
MEHNITPKTDTNDPSDVAETERVARTAPLIYVASLSDYNNGELHGQWIDARLGIDEINEKIAVMLAKSQDPGAEEYAIHDYEGFYQFQVGEYDRIETVHAIAEGIQEHGEAYAAYVELVGTEDASLDTFDDCYRGTYATLTAFVDQFVDDMGWLEEIAKFGERTGLGPYLSIDYSDLESSMRMEWDVIEGEEGVHIFTR